MTGVVAMQILVSGTPSCSENWADYSWAELSNVCFMDAPWYMRYFNVILILLLFANIILVTGAIIHFRNFHNKAKRPDYHQYLKWHWGALIVVAAIFWFWVLTTHLTPQAVITSIYSPIAEDGLFVLSPDGVGLVYERTCSTISIVVLLLTSQLFWVVILLWNPRRTSWMAVRYPKIICPSSTRYKFQMDGLKEWHRKAGIVFIGDSTFHLCHDEDAGLIELSIRKPAVAHVLCRYRDNDGKWSGTPIMDTSNAASIREEVFDKTIPITESIAITLEPLWYCSASGGCYIATRT